MNVIVGKKIGFAAMGLTALSLSACASAFAPETDARSPLAPEIQQLVDANRRYPRWEDFPKAPTDLPTSEAIASRVASLDSASAGLARERAAIPWTLEDPGGFAESVRSRVEASQPSPATARTVADVEAFAQRLRDRAVAPPPADRFRRPPG
ncbi:hypothetical protein ASG17_09505 [Brevundimonas sp. Leaf363]|nr:hypothetical protein ASG17_09505 [Brevundimonas sp. Leaf363]